MSLFDWKSDWVLLLLAVAVVQWLVFVVLSIFSRKPAPKKASPGLEYRLLLSTAALAVVWLTAFDAKSFVLGSEEKVSAASAAAVAPSSMPRATCASIKEGETAAEVKSKLGEPDKVKNEEDTRGPGAKVWVYAGSRCSVHLVDDTVDFID